MKYYSQMKTIESHISCVFFLKMQILWQIGVLVHPKGVMMNFQKYVDENNYWPLIFDGPIYEWNVNDPATFKCFCKVSKRFKEMILD